MATCKCCSHSTKFQVGSLTNFLGRLVVSEIGTTFCCCLEHDLESVVSHLFEGLSADFAPCYAQKCCLQPPPPKHNPADPSAETVLEAPSFARSSGALLSSHRSWGCWSTCPLIWCSAAQTFSLLPAKILAFCALHLRLASGVHFEEIFVQHLALQLRLRTCYCSLTWVNCLLLSTTEPCLNQSQAL